MTLNFIFRIKKISGKGKNDSMMTKEAVMQTVLSTKRPQKLTRPSGAEFDSPPPLPPDSENKQKQHAIAHTPLKVNEVSQATRQTEL